MASTVAPPMTDFGSRGSMPPTPADTRQAKRERRRAKQEMLIKTFAPARKKLTVVESQRIVNAFDEALRRLDLGTLIHGIAADLTRFQTGLGVVIVDGLRHHDSLVRSFLEKRVTVHGMYRRQAERTETLWDLDDGESYARLQLTELHRVEGRLRGATREILRGFAKGVPDPSALEMIQQKEGSRSAAASESIVAFRSLRAFVFERLLTTPMEEEERHQYLREITIRDRKNSEMIERLEGELRSAQADKDLEIKERNDVIRKLQMDLHALERGHEDAIKRARGEAEKQENADIKNSDGKRQKLLHEIAQLKAQLVTITAEHRESENALRKRKYKIETEVENWIQKFDADISEKQEEYDAIDDVYSEEKRQLNELEERFRRLEDEYNSIMEERRLEQEKKEAAEREMAAMIRASITIQSFWRAFKARRALKGKKKKGGKGKKKSGKKKQRS